MSEQREYQNILVERRGAVGIITLDRPQALNALNAALISELAAAIEALEHDDAIGALVLTGNDKAFAAGADVKEMLGKTYPETYLEDFITQGWERVAQCRKPVIAAVAGFALGGGCEIAMMCDIVIAADTARFGQPEINLGTMPGAGGTQRLTRFIGKAKAMDLCLTGRMMDAAEAERAGLVSRIVPAADLLAEAVKVAERICEMSRPIAMMVKESSTAPMKQLWPRACGSSAGSFTRPSRPKTAKKGWPPLSKSANPPSATVDPARKMRPKPPAMPLSQSKLHPKQRFLWTGVPLPTVRRG